jgi:hypothetical protein
MAPGKSQGSSSRRPTRYCSAFVILSTNRRPNRPFGQSGTRVIIPRRSQLTISLGGLEAKRLVRIQDNRSL